MPTPRAKILSTSTPPPQSPCLHGWCLAEAPNDVLFLAMTTPNTLLLTGGMHMV